MVTLLLDSVNKQGKKQRFALGADTLEAALDMADPIVNKENGIVEATLATGAIRIDLPLYIFDGQSFKNPIRQLKKEWTRILRQPIQNRQQPNKLRAELVQVTIDECEQRIAFLELSLCKFEQHVSCLRLTAETGYNLIDVFNFYERLCNLYRRLLANAHDRKEKHVHRLKTLQA